MSTIEIRVAQSNHDAEEAGADGSVSTNGSVLDMGNGDDTAYVAMLFENAAIPQGATITNAYIEFYAHASTSGAVDMDVYGEDTDDSTYFTTATNDISNRTLTTAKVDWTPSVWTANTSYQLTGLETIVQEIVDRAGWSSGNDLAIIIQEMASSDRRRAKTYDGDSANAPLLHVEFTVGTTGSQDITLSTGTDDAYEVHWDGSVDTTGTNVPIGEHDVGIRAPGVNVPAGATVTNAYLSFDSSGGDSNACSVNIYCEAADSAATFDSGTTNDITNRTKTSASVAWNSIPAWTSLTVYDTPELKEIIQEVIDRPGWTSGNALVFLFDRDAVGERRRARTVENGTGENPTLHIEWDTASSEAHGVSIGYGIDEVTAFAVEKFPALVDVGYSLDVVTAEVGIKPPIAGVSVGYSLDTVQVNVKFAIEVEDIGYSLDTVKLPIDAVVIAQSVGYALDVASAYIATKRAAIAQDIGYSLDTVVAETKIYVAAVASDRGFSLSVVSVTAVQGEKVDPTLAPVGIVSGIIHQLDIRFKSIFGE